MEPPHPSSWMPGPKVGQSACVYGVHTQLLLTQTLLKLLFAVEHVPHDSVPPQPSLMLPHALVPHVAFVQHALLTHV
jgi:hypothetical protein